MELERPSVLTPEEMLNRNRELIDAIDRELVELLNRRSAVVLEIGQIKMEHGLPIHVPSREEAVLEKISDINEGGLVPPDEMRSIFQAIMKGSRALQQQILENDEEHLTIS